MKNIIYLDNAATTFPKPSVVYDFMDKYYKEMGVNPGRGRHFLARQAAELVDETREMIADLAGFSIPQRVVFAPTATIAINQILRGLEWENINNVYISPFEHNAVVRTLYSLKEYYKFNIIIIDFDRVTLDMDKSRLIQNMSYNKPDLIIASHVSNVFGFILPIEEIIKISYKYNPIFVLDCSQSLGLVDLDIKKLNVDFLVFAGHKTLYGPFGVSGYIDNSKVKLKYYITGGTGSESTNLEMPSVYPTAYEAGSLNIHSIAGLNASLKWIQSIGVNNIFIKKKNLTQSLVDKLLNIDDVIMYLPKDRENHIGIISFNVKGYSPDQIESILDNDFNVAIRAGFHCAPLIGKYLGIEQGTVRASLGYFNTETEVELLYKAIEEIVEG